MGNFVRSLRIGMAIEVNRRYQAVTSLARCHVRLCWIFDEIRARLPDNINVTDQRLGLRVAGLIFAAFCVAHLLRIIAHADVQIAGYNIPMWPSWLAIVVAASISGWLLSLSNRR